MSELSFEQMLDESFKTIRNGEVVEGTIIGVKAVSYTHLHAMGPNVAGVIGTAVAAGTFMAIFGV